MTYFCQAYQQNAYKRFCQLLCVIKDPENNHQHRDDHWDDERVGPKRLAIRNNQGSPCCTAQTVCRVDLLFGSLAGGAGSRFFRKDVKYRQEQTASPPEYCNLATSVFIVKLPITNMERAGCPETLVSKTLHGGPPRGGRRKFANIVNFFTLSKQRASLNLSAG